MLVFKHSSVSYSETLCIQLSGRFLDSILSTTWILFSFPFPSRPKQGGGYWRRWGGSCLHQRCHNITMALPGQRWQVHSGFSHLNKVFNQNHFIIIFCVFQLGKSNHPSQVFNWIPTTSGPWKSNLNYWCFFLKVWLFKVKRYPWAVSYGNKYLDRTIEWTRGFLRRQVPIRSPQNSDAESGKSVLIFMLKVKAKIYKFI